MQTFSTALQAYFGHNVLAIQIIVAVTISIILVWFFRNLGKESRDDRTTRESMPEIEAALRRILDGVQTPVKSAKEAAQLIQDDEAKPAQAANASSAAPSATGAPGATAAPTSAPKPQLSPIGQAQTAQQAAAPAVDAGEITKLKSDVESKAKKLSELEAALASAQAELTKAKSAPAGTPGADGGGGAEVGELNRKIKDLEARLGEYEIIEDDIANLSIYKEENARLKSELEKMKGGAAPTPTPAPAPVPVAAPAAKAPATPAAAATPSPAPANPTPTAAPASATPPPAEGEGHDPVKQVDSNKLLEEFQEMAAAPKEEPKSTGETKDVGEKLIAEFENFMKGGS
ncbi:MAG: hypothetical protein IT289_03845 [Oligoflexia bacterium]|nr:hypothetical protein [Oligoflexia bacterium]